MKKLLCILIVLCLPFVLFACKDRDGGAVSAGKTAVTDVFGRTSYLDGTSRVVSCYASFSDCWLLSGGTLVGVTDDAVEEHGLEVGDAVTVGTVKHVDMERLISLEPDYVILSADLSAHLSLREGLDALGIDYGYFRVDVFADYRALMEQFCAVSGRDDLFEKNVSAAEAEIESVMKRIPETDSSVLLIRAFSTGMKAKTDDNLAGRILEEFGLTNIAHGQTAMTEDLSVEHIVRSDPDFIFATTMGSEEGARQYLSDNAENNPAWQGLTAVKQGNYHLLPKELFHYKPNDRWGESYEYLAKIIFPQVFGEE